MYSIPSARCVRTPWRVDGRACEVFIGPSLGTPSPKCLNFFDRARCEIMMVDWPQVPERKLPDTTPERPVCVRAWRASVPRPMATNKASPLASPPG